MNLKQIALYTLAVVVVTAGVTKYYFPNIETSIKIEEKEVIKKDIRTIIRERTNPDGSTSKETEIIDRSKERSSKEIESITIKKKDWYIAVGTTANISDKVQSYNLQVNRRILGPFYLGGTVSTNKELGVHIGMEF